jgi:ubiquinone/menaquinone biosynthesis C-methylase UbiE
MLKKLLSHLHAPVYQKRLSVLADLILPHLRQGDAILDVGCGSGQFGAELVRRAADNGINFTVSGLESFPRGGEPITVTPYKGGAFPFGDRSFDVTMVADVLHHEKDPMALLYECIRVSKRYLVIKDHQLAGPLANVRVSFIDWAANAPYGVKCLYRYNTPQQWESILRSLKLKPVALYPALNLYPGGLNFLFGRKLQYLAICQVPDQ